MKPLHFSIGFIGGGRATRIFFQAMKKQELQCQDIRVFDPEPTQIEKLQQTCPEIRPVETAREAASSDLVFLAVHPPEIQPSLETIRSALSSDAVVVSLAPKITIESIKHTLANDCPVIRMIPNAPAVINRGYNVIAYSSDISFEDNPLHNKILMLFRSLGEVTHTDEKKLEAYAVISGMGPTYLWFQLHELYLLAKEFGLADEEAREAVSNMVMGSTETLLHTDLSYDEVIDLIPFHPLSQHHEKIRKIYREVLTNLYQRLKP